LAFYMSSFIEKIYGDRCACPHNFVV